MTDLETVLIMLIMIILGINFATWLAFKQVSKDKDIYANQNRINVDRVCAASNPPYLYWIDENELNKSCSIFASHRVEHRNGEIDITLSHVKTFYCHDDPDFARLQAEELLEKLQEK